MIRDGKGGNNVRPKIGIALGSGGARGLAHIGVLKAFEEHQIPIDFISGSSMGSFIGAMYANGNDLVLMEKLANHLKRKHWVDFSVPKLGLVAGEKAKELIKILTHGKNIEDFKIPLAIVATNIETGEREIFMKGPAYKAVRASISIPGIFVPEEIDGKKYVDGGVIDRVPVQAAKNMGADLVIAIDVGLQDARKIQIKGIFDVIAQTIDIMERQNFQKQILSADYVIRPNVGHISSISFTNLQEIIDEGYRAAKEHIKAIEELIKVRGENNGFK